VEISTAGSRSRALAGFLTQQLQTSHGQLFTAIREADALEAVNADDTITLVIVDGGTSGACSVAGTCDVERRTITVSRASAGRMRYSVLHELGHLLMAECDDYQDAYVDLLDAVSDRARLTEDVCEAFAASLLLPDSEKQIANHSVTLDARGLRDLANGVGASREACAVWVSQHMSAPGYALICQRNGLLQFAARSGDSIPLSRGASQLGSTLQPLFGGALAVRERGRLRFGSGALGEELYIDAVRDEQLVYAVATTDSPDWPVLHQPFVQPTVEAIEGWCEECSTSFRAYRTCTNCGAPKHQECDSCECPPGTGVARVCTNCFLEQHTSRFDGSSAVCRDCLN
jgi:IrrE N-terminal-like domain